MEWCGRRSHEGDRAARGRDRPPLSRAESTEIERRSQESILKKLHQLQRENRKLKDENYQLKEENKKLKETLQKIHEEKNSENTSKFEIKEQHSKKQLPVHESFFQRVQMKPSQFQKLVKLQFYQFENLLKRWSNHFPRELKLVRFVKEQL